MDNDKKLVKLLRQAVKQLKFKFDYRDVAVLPETQGCKAISDMIYAEKPAFVARGGATEMRCIGEYLKKWYLFKSDQNGDFNIVRCVSGG